MFDSRKTPRAKGIGYPSANTELALLEPNIKDPHGYYRTLGVDPGVSMAQLRKHIRALLFQLHPDTGNGDVESFNHVRNIADVLLDEESRTRYNLTPKGMRLMDAVYAAEISKLDDLVAMDEEELKEVFQPVKAPKNPFATSLGARYDYFAINQHADPWQADGLKAQLWYHFLLDAAPIVRYKRVIKVLLTDGDADYHHDVGIMVIPRKWDPSSGLALSLFTHIAGFRPGHNDPETRLSFVRPTVSQ